MAWPGTGRLSASGSSPARHSVDCSAARACGSEPETYVSTGYSVPFVTAGALAFAMFCVAWRFLPESRAPASYPAQVPSTEGSRSRGGLGLRPLLALVVASEFGLALFEGTFVIFAKDRLAIGPTRAAVAFMVCGLVMAVFQVVAVSVFARFVSSIVQVALGLALMGGGIAWLIAIHSFGVALGAIAVLAFGTALVIPNLSALVSAHRGARTGSALGLKNAASSLGQFGGPFVGGVLVGWREDSPFAIASIGLLAAALVVGVVSANRATWDDDRDNAPTAVG